MGHADQLLLSTGMNRLAAWPRRIKRLFLPICLLLGMQGLLNSLWSGLEVRPVIVGSIISIPGLFLLMLTLSYIRGPLIRAAATGALFLSNYAQFTFQSYFGRFIGTDELRLAVANPTHELLASAMLYFSTGALVATLATTAIYARAMYVHRDGDTRIRIRVLASAALIAWCALVDTALPGQRAYSPVVAIAATHLRSGLDLLQALNQPPLSREEPPSPTGSRADFDVIFIVGESLRADRFHPGAYRRNISANLTSLRLPHVAFSNVASDGDCTNRSLPLLMVEPSQPISANIFKFPTLFSYAKAAGYRTSFVTANDNEWREFIDPHIDFLRRNLAASTHSEQYTFSNDDDMLPVIAGIAQSADKHFMVVESYAAHWPYSDRYESCPLCRRYLPDRTQKPLSFSPESHREIENSYDNAVIYFDQFVDQLIRGLTRPSLIVITSDHGESLGEAGKWGHCSAGLQQMWVPLVFIATDATVARAAAFQELQEHRDFPVSHANIFPTLLRIFGFQLDTLTRAYNPDLYSVRPEDGARRRVLVSAIGNTDSESVFRYIANGHLLEDSEPTLSGQR